MSPTEIESLLHTFTIGLGILLAALLYLIILIMLAKVLAAIGELRAKVFDAMPAKPHNRAALNIRPVAAMPAAPFVLDRKSVIVIRPDLSTEISEMPISEPPKRSPWHTDETPLKAE